MTESRILDLAYFGALKAWQRERDLLEKDPTNKIWAEKERKAWDELQTLAKLLREDEKNRNAD